MTEGGSAVCRAVKGRCRQRIDRLGISGFEPEIGDLVVNYLGEGLGSIARPIEPLSARHPNGIAVFGVNENLVQGGSSIGIFCVEPGFRKGLSAIGRFHHPNRIAFKSIVVSGGDIYNVAVYRVDGYARDSDLRILVKDRYPREAGIGAFPKPSGRSAYIPHIGICGVYRNLIQSADTWNLIIFCCCRKGS